MKLELPSNISHVYQGSMGCFVACVAMLLGKTYNQAYKLVHPSRAWRSGNRWNWYDGEILNYSFTHVGTISPEKAFKRLERLGLKPRYVKVKKLNLLHKTAIIWLRWDSDPTLMHSVVYDSKTKMFWDPMNPQPLNKKQKRNLERQIDSVIYLDAYKPPTGPPNHIQTTMDIKYPVTTWTSNDYDDVYY